MRRAPSSRLAASLAALPPSVGSRRRSLGWPGVVWSSAASAASAGGVRQQGRDLRELPLAIASIARWEHLEDELQADVHYYREGHLRVVEDAQRLTEVQPWLEAQRELGLDIRLVDGDDLAELAPGLSPGVSFGTYTPNDGHANPILTTKAFAAAAARYGAHMYPFT